MGLYDMPMFMSLFGFGIVMMFASVVNGLDDW